MIDDPPTPAGGSDDSSGQYESGVPSCQPGQTSAGGFGCKTPGPTATPGSDHGCSTCSGAGGCGLLQLIALRGGPTTANPGGDTTGTPVAVTPRGSDGQGGCRHAAHTTGPEGDR